MKSNYKIDKPTGKLEVQIEQTVIDKLKVMSDYSKHSVSELLNTAAKRFISAHSDFMPPKSAQPTQNNSSK